MLELPARALHTILDGPTLIHLNPDNSPALFISVLLHGNETSGWYAISRWLKENPNPRNLILFVGNVQAAAQGQRSLPGQPDYNRIWRNCDLAEGQIANQVLDYLQRSSLLLAVDLHNNTGRNPHYTVITDQRPETLALAEVFSDKAVYVEEPDTVLSRAVSDFCPSVAVELGPIDDPASDARAYDLVKRLTKLTNRPSTPAQAMALYRAIARVHVDTEASFDFADHHHTATDVTLTAGIEGVNFHEIPAGTTFGRINRQIRKGVYVLDPSHQDVTGEFFSQDNGELRLSQPVIPAMYTTDPAVVKQDCLCYFMQRI